MATESRESDTKTSRKRSRICSVTSKPYSDGEMRVRNFIEDDDDRGDAFRMAPSNEDNRRKRYNEDCDGSGYNRSKKRKNATPNKRRNEPSPRATNQQKIGTAYDLLLQNKVQNNELSAEDAERMFSAKENAPRRVFCDPQRDDSQVEQDSRFKNIDPKIVDSIKHVICELDDTNWDSIAGLEQAKKKIQQVAILPLLRPDIFTGIRAPPKGILLFGPPGTGKTMIGRCIASQAKATFFSVTASTLTSKWIGEGEKTMSALFSVARAMKPSVIFIDEIDSLLKARSNDEDESSRRMKTEFLSQFDGLKSQHNEQLLVIGTTNRPEELDDAVRRRFAVRIFISLPCATGRKKMLENILKNEKHSLTSEQIEDIVARTEGYVGSDMTQLATQAAFFSTEEIWNNMAMDKAELRDITHDDLIKAMELVPASFNQDNLQPYLEWNNKFGAKFDPKP